MKYLSKTNLLILFAALLMSTQSFGQLAAESLTDQLCKKSWHLVKLTDITGKGASMGGEILMVETKFNSDGTLETTTRGTMVKDTWRLLPDGKSIETSQLKDPKTGQEKISIVEVSDLVLKIQITYRGNNIMQYDYN